MFTSKVAAISVFAVAVAALPAPSPSVVDHKGPDLTAVSTWPQLLPPNISIPADVPIRTIPLSVFSSTSSDDAFTTTSISSSISTYTIPTTTSLSTVPPVVPASLPNRRILPHTAPGSLPLSIFRNDNHVHPPPTSVVVLDTLSPSTSLTNTISSPLPTAPPTTLMTMDRAAKRDTTLKGTKTKRELTRGDTSLLPDERTTLLTALPSVRLPPDAFSTITTSFPSEATHFPDLPTPTTTITTATTLYGGGPGYPKSKATNTAFREPTALPVSCCCWSLACLVQGGDKGDGSADCWPNSDRIC